jgi:hypothetical protein
LLIKIFEAVIFKSVANVEANDAVSANEAVVANKVLDANEALVALAALVANEAVPIKLPVIKPSLIVVKPEELTCNDVLLADVAVPVPTANAVFAANAVAPVSLNLPTYVEPT